MRWIAGVLLLLVSQVTHAQTAAPGAGIPLAIAERRAAIISNLRYALNINVPEKLSEPITGTTGIQFSLSDRSAPLVIDFATSRANVKSFDANGASAFEFVNGHIVVPAASLKQGENTITIAFTAGDASLNRSADFMYTLFVPARAHLAFPVFDQPNLKARWSLILRVPPTWKAAANGAEISASSGQERR